MIQRKCFLLALIAFLVSLTGCFKITYKLTSKPGEVFVDDKWQSFFVLGFGSSPGQYSLDDFCKAGSVTAIEHSMGPENIFSTIASSALYSSYEISAWCLKSK